MTTTTDVRFAIVPEWVVDADVSHGAVRLYCVLSRYADSDGTNAFPSRATLAERLRCSKDTVDRMLVELIDLDAVVRTRRHRTDGGYASNTYTVKRIPPGTDAATPSRNDAVRTSRNDAATPSRTDAALPRALQTESPKTMSSSDDESPTALVPATKVAEDGWDTARELCDYLAEAIVESGGRETQRPSVTQAWVATMEKVVRIDERTPAQVRAAIDWTHRSSGTQGAWWQDKVLSPDALRRHWEKMRRQASRRDTRSTPPGVDLAAGYADAAERLRSRA